MEHGEAMQSAAAERYILGELNAAEADSFEEHFFDCRECADEVRTGAAFLEGGRKLVRQAKEEPGPATVISLTERRKHHAWLPTAVAAVLLLGIGTPLLLRLLSDARPAIDIPTVHVLQAGTRAAGEPVPTVRTGDIVYVDVLGEPSYARYELRVLDPKGQAFLTRTVTPDQVNESLPLVLRGWGPGTYELVIVGMDPAGQSAEISRHRFTVKA